MKQKFNRAGGKALRGIWLCVLALTVTAVVTAPLALSRYTAQGLGSARARIASWDPQIALTGWPATGDQKFVLFNNDINKKNSYTGPSFSVTNNGETLINAKPRLVDAATGNTLAGVTFNPTNADIPIGGAVGFTMTVSYSGSGYTLGTEYTAELRVQVDQVD